MTKDRNQLSDDLTDDNGAGWINRFLADEDEFDRRAMWRLASWGVGSVAALVVAILATRSPAAINRDQTAAAELARQSQQVQWIARESQNKARELAAAVETLNADRDRLYTRVTVLEQGLDSVTGALAKPPASAASATPQPTPSAEASPPGQVAAAATTDPIGPIKPADPRSAEAKTEAPASLPKIAPVATVVPVTPPAPVKPAEQKAEQKTETSADPSPPPVTTAAIPTADPAPNEMLSASIVRRTEFGVDLGSARSIEGLRAMWRGAVKSNAQHLASLQPIIVVKERNDGLGMQLRLVAGPLADAAEAAKVCAGLLTESNRPCETSVYEGQRLSLIGEPRAETPHPVQRPKRRGKSRGEISEEKPKTSSFSSFFGVR